MPPEDFSRLPRTEDGHLSRGWGTRKVRVVLPSTGPEDLRVCDPLRVAGAELEVDELRRG
ncbi:hypothetical protein HS1genome_1367 [Sulfodiicoccus acidiphilus]|uniref:Uncharacterized protein n=1 Tax=Sulfodiicoccus acidiphilus TaxID=1670455 RepID=A0A348B476_9CREN|nr:hypothetical protein [Sulfodiicoccus acidiphilus]BBD72978.1 hypothetical protein HS1genome_1367 [Sulfodiicoccus acidiphilus]